MGNGHVLAFAYYIFCENEICCHIKKYIEKQVLRTFRLIIFGIVHLVVQPSQARKRILLFVLDHKLLSDKVLTYQTTNFASKWPLRNAVV